MAQNALPGLSVPLSLASFLLTGLLSCSAFFGPLLHWPSLCQELFPTSSPVVFPQILLVFTLFKNTKAPTVPLHSKPLYHALFCSPIALITSLYSTQCTIYVLIL